MTLEESFRVLELPRSASIADVKRAYRRLARLYHPDRHHNEDAHAVQKAEARMKRLNSAYRTLSQLLEPRKRSGPRTEAKPEDPKPGPRRQTALSRFRIPWVRGFHLELTKDNFGDYAFALFILAVLAGGLVSVAYRALESPLPWVPIFIVEVILVLGYCLEIVRSFALERQEDPS